MKTLSEKRTNNNKENTRIKKTESLIKTTFIELVQKYVEIRHHLSIFVFLLIY